MSGALEFPSVCPMCGHTDGLAYPAFWQGPVYRRERGSDKEFRLFQCEQCHGYIAWRNDDQLIQRSVWDVGVDISEFV